MATQVSFVHYKFQTEKYYRSLPIEGNFINLGELKERIFQTRFWDRRKGVQLVVLNAQTGEQYHGDKTDLIMRNTSLVLRRLPNQCLLPIVANDGSKVKNSCYITPQCPCRPCLSLEAALDLDDFGDDPFAGPQPPKPALDAFMQETTASQGFESQRLGFEPSKTPLGYVCHRCGIPGHLIQHCPTNADTTYNNKSWMKPYAVAVAVSKRDEAAFDRFLDGTHSSSSQTSVGELPPELHCPLCRQVMKDAVIASKCCYDSFCDRCIRSHLLSKLMCVCKATTTRADNLLPNITLRETIARLLASKPNSSTSGAESHASHIQPRSEPADPKKPTALNQDVSPHEKQHKLHPRSSSHPGERSQDQKRHKLGCYAPEMSHASNPYNRPVWSVHAPDRFCGQASSISAV